MNCDYFDAGVCHSCASMGVPIVIQRRSKLDRARAAVAPSGDPGGVSWLPAFGGPEAGFRNKAKMVVGGTLEAPTLGILDDEHHGVDLRECGILLPGLRAMQPALAAFITLAGLTPYDVSARRGELKHVITTESPDGERMVRFVLRSTEALPRIRKHLPTLLAAAPGIRVVTANLHPTHSAILEGAEELVLTEAATLPMRLTLRGAQGDADLALGLPPRSFFQTNTEVAAGLYAQAAAWATRSLREEAAPGTSSRPPASPGERKRIVDLYCGVGGFGLALAGEGREVIGVETSEDAIEAANAVAGAAGIDARFLAGDAREWLPTSSVAAATGGGAARPDLVIVNPPRRGLGPELSATLEESGVPTVIYSSCNPDTLARDLALMPSYRAVEARLFDMFPQTEHQEVMVLLQRR